MNRPLDGSQRNAHASGLHPSIGREGLLRLGDAGLVFQPGAGMQELQRWLVYSQSMANVNVSHVNLGTGPTVGWGTDGAFRTFRAFMGDEVNALESDYAGELSVKPTGSLEAWLDMVREHVLGHTPLTAMLLSAFAAPLLPLISKDADLGSLIFSLCSPTSKGKTEWRGEALKHERFEE